MEPRQKSTEYKVLKFNHIICVIVQCLVNKEYKKIFKTIKIIIEY